MLGRGGMGSVEAALAIEPVSAPGDPAGTRPSESYERVVALKRLLPDTVHDKRRVEMFLREARLAAMLDHPNVVRAYDYGEIEGELYLAMEYVEGQPLSRILKALEAAGEKMSPATAAWILAEICRGLHAAHELTDPATGAPLQLVHRDVSPHNVMIGYDGRVRLLDFGVAKIEAESVTKTGEVKGKTAYMSPEQAMGDRIDRRSDLFSVGAVLYECVTLQRMWGDGTDMEVIRKLALESPPSLDGKLGELHARLVAREAKDRPPDAKEVADALMAFVDDAAAAAEALRKILSAHFADEARERRAELAAAIEEAAPDQAEELRESVLPPSARESLRLRMAEKAAVKATAPAVEAETKRRSPAVAIGAVAIALVGVIGWRMAWSAHADAKTTSTPSATATATTTATTTATATVSAVASIAAPSTRPSASTTPSTSTTAAASSVRIVRPRVTAPVNSAKAPDLDEKPF